MIAIFPETLVCAAKGDIEELAVVTRRYYGGEEKFAPRLDVFALAARIGLTVETLPIEGLGALVAKDERGSFTISAFLSPQIDKVTARFLLAHMLGHYFLDIQPLIAKGDWQRSGFREGTCPMRRYTQGDLISENATYELAKEVRADLYAAALLMPMGMVRRAAEALKNVDKVAEFFGVPKLCLERRLTDIGIIHKDPENFLAAEAAMGREISEAMHNDETAALTGPAEPVMPRSFAASSYGQTAKSTARKAPAATPASTQTSSTTPAPASTSAPEVNETKGTGRPVASRTQAAGPVGRSGMKRLREIARQLDKFGTKSEG